MVNRGIPFNPENTEQCIGIARLFFKWVIAENDAKRKEASEFSDEEILHQVFMGAYVGQILPAFQTALNMGVVPRDGVNEILALVSRDPEIREHLERMSAEHADEIFKMLDERGIKIQST